MEKQVQKKESHTEKVELTQLSRLVDVVHDNLIHIKTSPLLPFIKHVINFFKCSIFAEKKTGKKQYRKVSKRANQSNY